MQIIIYLFQSFTGNLLLVHGIHRPLRILHTLQDPCPEPVLPGAPPPDRRVLPHLLRDDAVSSHTAHVPQLPLTHTHGFSRYQSPHGGDALHTG